MPTTSSPTPAHPRGAGSLADRTAAPPEPPALLARALQVAKRMRMASAANDLTVAAVMRRRWISVSPLASLRDALQIMRMARLRQVPVAAADGILKGMLGYPALVQAVLATEASQVAQVMSPEAETGEAQMPIAEAAARIARSQTGCLPVVEPGPDGARLVGLVTEADLLRLAYEPARGSARA